MSENSDEHGILKLGLRDSGITQLPISQSFDSYQWCRNSAKQTGCGRHCRAGGIDGAKPSHCANVPTQHRADQEPALGD
jgi:hypothetical protein